MNSPALLIDNLTKVYSNGHKALHGINLEIPHGDFFALLGPNGAGKSTWVEDIIADLDHYFWKGMGDHKLKAARLWGLA